MKNLIFFLLLIVILIPACKENPVEEQESKEVKLDWKQVYYSTNPRTLDVKSGSDLSLIFSTHRRA